MVLQNVDKLRREQQAMITTSVFCDTDKTSNSPVSYLNSTKSFISTYVRYIARLTAQSVKGAVHIRDVSAPRNICIPYGPSHLQLNTPCHHAEMLCSFLFRRSLNICGCFHPTLYKNGVAEHYHSECSAGGTVPDEKPEGLGLAADRKQLRMKWTVSLRSAK
jgi:hypothetical protein